MLQSLSITAHRADNTVSIRTRQTRIRRWRARANEDRRYQCAMTCSMKVFQVERVIPDLIHMVALKFRFPNLELDGKDRWTGNECGIQPTPKTRNIKLEKNGSSNACERTLQDRNLVEPGVALVGFDCVCAMSCDFPKHFLRSGIDERRCVRSVVGI